MAVIPLSSVQQLHYVALIVLTTCLAVSCAVDPTTNVAFTATGSRQFYGLGGLSGGGATGNFLHAYPEKARNQILDLLFKPGDGAALSILKVEMGCDDQTTDGCESCHMRDANTVDCTRGYEWSLMAAAVKRNPAITLYGLPWGFAGWLGHNSTNPYSDPIATADYTAKWIECGRDTHGVNITVMGLWNEADVSFESQIPYMLALRKRLDNASPPLTNVRIGGVPDSGSLDGAVEAINANESVREVVWGLGAHYPGQKGTTQAARDLGIPLWASEDYSTYSDATGGGCWGRLLVQNAAWQLSATISWYVIAGFARGMHYDGDGFLRAEWPESGHFEVTPMFWYQLHWSLFTEPGWQIMQCSDLNTTKPASGNTPCTLSGGGNYAVMFSSDENPEATVIVEALRHNQSQCIRNDPPGDWPVADQQAFNVAFPKTLWKDNFPQVMHLWSSCVSWEYPATDDSYLQQQEDVHGETDEDMVKFEFQVRVGCYYTLTTVANRRKPEIPATASPAPFPLPYHTTFEPGAINESPYFGDQMGKWETVPARGGRAGHAMQQMLPAGKPWPILEPQCNVHSSPITIIGDMWWEDVSLKADVLIEDGTGAGFGLRTRFGAPALRAKAGGIFLYLQATPPLPETAWPGGIIPSPPQQMTDEWLLCADSYCVGILATGAIPKNTSAYNATYQWRTVQLDVTGNTTSAYIDGAAVLQNFPIPEMSIRAACNNSFGCTTPASGWASFTSTLGNTQVDNLELKKLGAHASGHPCQSASPASGSIIQSMACSFPGSDPHWIVNKTSRHIHSLKEPTLCMANKDGAVSLMDCSTAGPGLLVHNMSTGLVQDASQCVAIQPRTESSPAVVAMSTKCTVQEGALQFQFSPDTGILRHKGSECIARWAHDFQTNYRDCCLALC